MNMEKKGSQGDGSVGPGRGVAQRSLKTRGLCAAEGDDCCPCRAIRRKQLGPVPRCFISHPTFQVKVSSTSSSAIQSLLS